MADKVLSVKDLVINFKTDSGILHAVRNVSFDLERGETLCIVGESGSGKSVTSKAIMGILANNAIIENGTIMYRGENLLEVSEEEFYKIRGHKIGMIFQDPLSSLNPIVKIGKQITEAMLINSDQLKLMYQDLISVDLIAYKNNLARRDINIENAKKILAMFIKETNKQLAKPEVKKDKQKVAELKEAIKNKKQETSKIIEKYKKEAAEKSPALKAKLTETKKAAKIKVKEYKAKITVEHHQKLNELREKLLDLMEIENIFLGRKIDNDTNMKKSAKKSKE